MARVCVTARDLARCCVGTGCSRVWGVFLGRQPGLVTPRQQDSVL